MYSKHSQDGVELLDSVIDMAGRKTTYSYQIKGAEFNLFSDYGERATSNPYALLSKVQMPTGAATEYAYEEQPIKRFMGASSFDESYRLTGRKDLITYDNGETREYNRQSLYYNNSDMGSVGDQDLQFSTTLNNGLTDTTFRYKKDYADDQTPAQFYLESSVQSANGLSKTTAYTYGKYVGSRTYPVPMATTVTSSNSANADVLTSSSKFDDYGNIIESTDVRGRTTTYTYDSRHLLKSMLEPANVGSFRYTELTRNDKGTMTQLIVRKDTATGDILQKVNIDSLDSYGNVTSQSIMNGAKIITKKIQYDNGSHAFPVGQQVDVTDAYQQISTVEVTAEYDLGTGLIAITA